MNYILRPLYFILLPALLFVFCAQPDVKEPLGQELLDSPYVQVLGIAQDAGFPQIGCTKACCIGLWDDLDQRKMVSCIALIDPISKNYWLFDATPDIKDQIARCQMGSNEKIEMPSGIFLTHAHIGHYTGLMQLGKEAYGAKGLNVYTMPRMNSFLQENGPWDQLVSLNNINLISIEDNKAVSLNADTKVIPLQVPHRDEYSETVGYKIIGADKKVLFIPDIDKWSKWNLDILEEIRSVDIAFLDGSFYKNGEIPNRDMSQIPHPFMEESMSLFASLSNEDRAKVNFIHFNHTNPVLQKGSEAYKDVLEKGYRIADEGQRFLL